MPESFLQLKEQLDLQKALYIVGAVIIFFLILNNFLRNLRLKKRMMENISKAAIQDTLEPQEMREPHLGPIEENNQLDKVESVPIENISEVISTESSSNSSTNNLSQTETYVSRMDPNIDCVVSLRFTLLIKGQEVIEKISHWPSNPIYRIAFEGLCEDGDKQVWEMVDENHEYRELQLSMQLANRRGPISKDDLAEFLGLASQLAQDIDAEIDLPPISQVLSQAEDLDHFAVQCDVQLSLNLVPNMISWAIKDVETSLNKNGFVLSRDGLSFNYFSQNYLIFKAQMPNLNVLTDDLQTHRAKNILFAMDVPLVPKELNAFSKMFEVAIAVANELDGKVLDDNGHVLEKDSIDLISAQLEPIYQMMTERQIPPGSGSAARLFS